DLGGKLTVINPEDFSHLELNTLKSVDFMTLSIDENGDEAIYFVQSDPVGIDRIKITDVEEDETVLSVKAKVLKSIVNADFREGTKDKIPGWFSLFADVTD